VKYRAGCGWTVAPISAAPSASISVRIITSIPGRRGSRNRLDKRNRQGRRAETEKRLKRELRHVVLSGRPL
jgi:hypothetical protein